MTYSPPSKDQPATEKQIAFIVSLLEQRSLTTEVKDHVEAQVASDTMTKAEASKRIEWLLAQPKAEKPKPVYVDAPEGMHKVGDKIFKVYRTRNGYIVAAELRGMMTDEGEVWGFEYRGKSGLKGLDETTRMPAEEAKAFGKTYGICVRCALHLTDERSIFAGYGPVCAKHEGWYYPKMDEAMEGLGITPDLVESLIAESVKLAGVTPPADEPESELPEYVRTPGLSPGDMEELKEAAEALESFAAVLKEHAILPDYKSYPAEWAKSGLTPEEIEERLDRVCDFPGCGAGVFTPLDIEEGVHLGINPDYCEIHDTEATESGMGPVDTSLTPGPLRMELLPEDL